MKNILILVFLITTVSYAQFSTNTVKKIDEIQNNTASDITINPDNKVLIPYLDNGELLYYNSGVDSLGNGSEGQILSIAGGILAWIDPPSTSPTTTLGDIIYNDGGGAASDERLAIGSNGTFLTVAAGVPAWQSIVTSPITTQGDISIGDASGDPVRLPIGGVDQILISSGSTLTYQDLPESVSVTTKGDLQTYSTTPDRLPVGADNQFLIADDSEATGLKWSDSITGLVSQAHYVGSYTYVLAASCSWAQTASSYASYAASGNCINDIVVGDVEAPSTIIPAVKIPNARTDGYYQVVAQGFFYLDSGSDGFVRLSDGVNSGGAMALNSTADSRLLNYISHQFKFSTSGDKQVEVQAQVNAGSLDILVNSGDRKLQFDVYFFPDSNNLAAIQNKTLTAETANELSAQVGSSEIVNSENYNWIDGNCTNPSLGKKSCTFVSGVFTEEPSCVATTWEGTTGEAVIHIASLNSSGIEVITRFNGATNDNVPFYLQCSKQGADVNKSQVITATFENINSTPINPVFGLGNAGGVGITGDSTLIPFTTVENPSGTWNGDHLIADLDGWYLLTGGIAQSVGGNYTRLVVDRGSGYTREKAQYAGGVTQSTFTYVVKLGAGDKVALWLSGSATLVNDDYHYINIIRFPDYESIIKNLNDNNNVECQTKYLSTDIIANTSDNSDLRFNNLEIGKNYKLIGQIEFGSLSASDTVSAGYQHNGSILVRSTVQAPSAPSSGQFRQAIDSGVFEATATTLLFEVLSLTNPSSTIGGTNSRDETFMQLCELPDNTILNSTKFN